MQQLEHVSVLSRIQSEDKGRNADVATSYWPLNDFEQNEFTMFQLEC
jgi:hypothetical protein